MKKKLNLVLWISWALFSLALIAKSFLGETTSISNSPKLEGEIRLMSWNLGSYCLSSRYYNGTYYKAMPKPQSQREAIAKNIAEIAPDILCIQEIGRDYFKLFQRELKSLGLDYPYFSLVENLDAKRCIAIISKVPFSKVKKYNNVKFEYQNGKFESVRGLLMVKVDDIFIATLHAKSRRPFENYPEDKNCEDYRQKELQSFAKILEHYKDEKLVLCGDFNEEPTHQNIKNFKSICNLSQVEQGSKADSWTYSYKNGKATNCFDFFLKSPSLKVKAPAKTLQNYKAASDHRAIYLDISPAP